MVALWVWFFYVSGRLLAGIRMALNWYLFGAGLVICWYCTGMVLVWHWYGLVRCGLVWYCCGSGIDIALLLIWYWFGIDMVLGWRVHSILMILVLVWVWVWYWHGVCIG